MMASMTQDSFEAIVVGSGFGGSVAALRLAEAGVQTCVIERGLQWERPGVRMPFPSMAGGDRRQAWRSARHPIAPRTWRSDDPNFPGLLERIEGADRLDVICGAAWGGGSVVYGGMFVQPEADDFERIFPGIISAREIAPYYERVRAIVRPEHPSRLGDTILGTPHYRSARVFDEHAEKAGLKNYLAPVQTTVDWDVVADELAGRAPMSASVGEAIMGFNSGAMKSLDKNYLKRAAAARRPIVARMLTIVNTITRESEGPHAGCYRLECTELTELGMIKGTRTYHARHLFLAAGSMNTTRLLCGARDRGTLPELHREVGQHWGGNGDVLVLRRGLKDTLSIKVASPHVMRFRQGTPTATSLYLPHPAHPVRIMLAPGMDLWARRMWMLGMSIPGTLGSFVRQGNSYTVRWPADGDRVGRERIEQITRQINRAAGGRMGDAPGRERTFHPLGGVVLGRACDEIGRVRGYDRLYVVDSSLFPGHTACCNPAWTVAAVAERCVEKIIAQDRVRAA